MKTRKITTGILSLGLIGLLGACGSKVETTANSIRNENIEGYINSLMNQTTSYVPAWNQESFKGKWNYIDGVMLNSLLNMSEVSGDKKYQDFVINYVDYYIDSNGDFVNTKNPEDDGYNQNYELDTICESKILFKLYDLTNDSRYLKAIDTTYNQVKNQPRTNEGSFWHKAVYQNQVWLDGLYMVSPFYTQYANKHSSASTIINGNTISLYDDIYLQYDNVMKNMYDETKGLFYHGYDASKSIFWADRQTGCSKSFWLRSEGWFLTSLVDVIENYPAGENRTKLIEILNKAISGILKYQDSTKLFYQVIDKGGQGALVDGHYFKDNTSRYVDNYLESSGSSMVAYTLLKGARLGILDSKYKALGEEVLNAVINRFFKAQGNSYSFSGICITAGLGPDTNTKRDGTFEYYLSETVGANDAKGVAPFLMAYTEYIR